MPYNPDAIDKAPEPATEASVPAGASHQAPAVEQGAESEEKAAMSDYLTPGKGGE